MPDAIEPGEAEALRFKRTGADADFAALLLAHRDRLYRVAYRMVHHADDALDLAQDAFLKIHAQIQQWDGRSRFSTWSYRVMVNLCIDFLRQRRRRQALAIFDDRPPESPTIGPQEEIEEREWREVAQNRLRRAVEDLPPAQRAVVSLRHYEGLALKDIAQVRELALGTVKSTLFQAYANLRRALDTVGTSAQQARG